MSEAAVLRDSGEVSFLWIRLFILGVTMTLVITQEKE